MTNMTEIVREYAKHESGIFEKTAELRAQWMRAETLDEKYDIKEKADKSLKGIIAIAEGYPELKADKNYLALQETLKDSESKTAFARQFYNDTVTIYNIKTEMFPSNIFAKLLGFDCEQLFEAKNLREEK